MKRRRAVERQLRLGYAPPVPIGPVVRLYRADAAWTLYARCLDVLLVSDGRVRCPECQFAVPWRGAPSSRTAACPGCGWQVTAAEYRNSVRGTSLQGHNARAVWAEYVARFPAARTYEERMLLVDHLVHGVHTSGQPAARNLFAGHPEQVLAALDRLAGALTVEAPHPIAPTRPASAAAEVGT